MYLRQHICKWVIYAPAIVAMASNHALFAQAPEETAAPLSVASTDQGTNGALLVANLAEYGEENEDALALLAAASILDRMEAGVARRDGTHDVEDMEHGSNGLFTVNALLAQASEVANNLDADSSRDVRNIVERLSQGEKNYLGFLHTHYVWWCDAWGNCQYRLITHY